MACEVCAVVPQPRKKHSYLISLIDTETARMGWCVVQSECTHDMQEWISDQAYHGGLEVMDKPLGADNQTFTMFHPTVLYIDPKAAAHIPIKDPVN
jgi:hypothetical protein